MIQLLYNMPNYICKRGYVLHKAEYSEEQLTQLRRDLTATPKVSTDYGPPPEPFACYLESENKLYIPIDFGLHRFGPAEDKRPEPAAIDLRFQRELRDNQTGPVDEVIQMLRRDGGAILAAYPSFGKTLCAYDIIQKLRVKALILVHKEFLAAQWLERAQFAYPHCSIGRIQADKFDIEGRDIVIGMIQTVSMRSFDLHAFDSFGIVIIDECHHISSKVFSKCLHKTASRYTLGLSGTPDRADGLLKVFQWHISRNMVNPPRPQMAEDVRVRVDIVKVSDTNPIYCREETNFKGKPAITTMITNITNWRPRTQLIVNKIREIVDSHPDRQVLVLSERRQHLTDIHDMLQPMESAYYLGGMKQRDLDASTRSRIILATMSMAQEALDIPSLNSMVLATSKGNVIQAVGRVLRRINPECPPWIIDIADTFSVFRNQLAKRRKYYQQMHFIVNGVGDAAAAAAHELAHAHEEKEDDSDNSDDVEDMFT